MDSLSDRITNIIEHWYLSDSALFQVVCLHELVENSSIACPVRCGRRRIEYNPEFLENMTDTALDEALRMEAVRIILKHPYERKPDMCCDEAAAAGSNITIGDNYDYGAMKIDRPSDYDLKGGMMYEWYARRIQEMLPPEDGTPLDSDDSGSSGDSGDTGSGRTQDIQERLKANSKANSDLAGLWEEDDLTAAMINGVIDSVKDWGSLAGSFAEQIKASTRARINWRTVFSGFRASVLSSRRKLTRMRPNRRSGFQHMGSTRDFETKLLIAVDVSGSISTEMLTYFYGVVNSAFKYGFEAVDVIQFDCGISIVKSLKKTMTDVTVIGRGGTSFTEPINYAHENGYDGLVILTDGYAPQPEIPDGFRTKILWVCEDKDSYDTHHQWMEQYGRVCTIELK